MPPNAEGNRRLVFRDQIFDFGTPLLRGGVAPFKGYRHVCSTCGELWGAVEVSTGGSYLVLTLPCEKHGTPFAVGGSFLKPLLWWGWPDSRHRAPARLFESLPERVMLHECLMKANQVLKG